MIVQVSLWVALSGGFQNPTSIVNVLKFQYRRQRGDNRGGLAGEWWDGQNFPWAEDLSNFLSQLVDFLTALWNPPWLFWEGLWPGRGGCWKVGQRQLASSPSPPWVHQVNVCARVVHPKYMPKKSLPRLSWDLAVSEVLRILETCNQRYGIQVVETYNLLGSIIHNTCG